MVIIQLNFSLQVMSQQVEGKLSQPTLGDVSAIIIRDDHKSRSEKTRASHPSKSSRNEKVSRTTKEARTPEPKRKDSMSFESSCQKEKRARIPETKRKNSVSIESASKKEKQARTPEPKRKDSVSIESASKKEKQARTPEPKRKDSVSIESASKKEKQARTPEPYRKDSVSIESASKKGNGARTPESKRKDSVSIESASKREKEVRTPEPKRKDSVSIESSCKKEEARTSRTPERRRKSSDTSFKSSRKEEAQVQRNPEQGGEDTSSVSHKLSESEDSNQTETTRRKNRKFSSPNENILKSEREGNISNSEVSFRKQGNCPDNERKTVQRLISLYEPAENEEEEQKILANPVKSLRVRSAGERIHAITAFYEERAKSVSSCQYNYTASNLQDDTNYNNAQVMRTILNEKLTNVQLPKKVDERRRKVQREIEKAVSTTASSASSSSSTISTSSSSLLEPSTSPKPEPEPTASAASGSTATSSEKRDTAREEILSECCNTPDLPVKQGRCRPRTVMSTPSSSSFISSSDETQIDKMSTENSVRQISSASDDSDMIRLQARRMVRETKSKVSNPFLLICILSVTRLVSRIRFPLPGHTMLLNVCR